MRSSVEVFSSPVEYDSDFLMESNVHPVIEFSFLALLSDDECFGNIPQFTPGWSPIIYPVAGIPGVSFLSAPYYDLGPLWSQIFLS